jgi:6-phosphogluconolactonase (cycloisomerase 2 family)
MVKKATALSFVCASVALWVSCGSTSRYLFTAIPASNEIIAYREDPNSGVLIELAGSPITAGTGVQSLALHPSKKFLYAANSGEGDVSLFTISSDGTITEQGTRARAGTAPTLLAIDSAGSYLYVGNAGSFDISVFSVDASSGTLSPVSQTSGPTAGIGVSPLNLQVSPSGSFLYVTGLGLPGLIEAFPLTKGVLGNPVAGSPFLTGTDPNGLAIAPSGSYLYVANTIDNSISEYKIQSNGSLAQFPNSPIGEQFSGPVALLIEETGKYLYVANEGSTNLAAYSIGGNTGALTLLASSPFATGAQPSVMATDPSGRYLFVGNQKNPAIESFSLDPGSGTLATIFTYSLPGTPTSIVVTH